MENRGRQSIAKTASILNNYNQSLDEKNAVVNPIQRKAVSPSQARPVGEKAAQTKAAQAKPAPAKSVDKKPMDLQFDDSKTNQIIRKSTSGVRQEGIISQERLQEAIIWSEIIGEPLSKRRKRR